MSLATALAAKRMSQAELARKLGVTRATISAYVRGEVIPPPERAAKIAEVLGADIDVRRKITVERVATAMAMSPRLLRRGLKGGELSALGVAIPTRNGRCSYRFYPERVRELVGID